VTTLPEQPADWTEPGAHPVAPGVYRIPVPLPHDGLKAVNIYAIDDPDGVVLIDSGWALPETEKAITDGLRYLGYDLGDIAHIAVTHAHADHYTQAVVLRQAFGTRVSIGRGERPTLDRLVDDEPTGFDDQYVQLRAYGATALADKLERWAKTSFDRGNLPWEHPDRWLDHGDAISLYDRTLDVISTPGHTRGHVVMRDAPAGLLFAGDHILPHITPSIGFEAVVADTPLRSYLESLRLVKDLSDTVLLPAHGPATPSVHRRVEELLVHHEVRLAAILREVQRGAGTAFEVAGALRWTRREKTLDELDPMNQMLAVLETGAHLDVLVLQGELRRTESDGVRTYLT
jgi:glyoxylase-like metal-dependent hydrolase (beta-lactamase superfamily II)